MINIRVYIILLFVFMFGANLSANDATEAFNKQTLPVKTLNLSSLESERANLEYATYPAVSKESYRTSDNIDLNLGRRRSGGIDLRDMAKGILIFLAVLLLLFLIVRFVAGDAVLYSSRIQRKQVVNIEDIESNLERADLTSFLDKALGNQDYRLAVRLYYLSIIKALSSAGHINWKKDKTNGQYLRELRYKKHANMRILGAVTRIFEYVWYSDTVFGKGQFEEIQLEFKQLLQSLN